MAMCYSEALRQATDAALATGALLRREFHRAGGPRGGNGHCQADLEAELLIRQQLTTAFPDWGYLGEETGCSDSLTDKRQLWLVDPNSGTSAYLEGYRGSSVSIALLDDGVPVLGVVYSFAAPDDEGDLFTWAEGCGALRRQGVEIRPNTFPQLLTSKDQILLSQRADDNSIANMECVAPARFRTVPGVAYRLAMVAAGEAVAMVSLDSPCSWDYAAGHALLRSVGGILLDQNGEEVRYTRDGRSETSFCFGGAPGVVSRLCWKPWQKAAPPEGEHNQINIAPFPERLKPGRALDDPALLSRAQGCLLGQIAGDSLGGLVEFERDSRLRMLYPDGLRQLKDGGIWGILAGQPTDDSELALMLARSIVSCGRYDPEVAAQAYSFWFRSNPFDIGAATRVALRATATSVGNTALLAKRAADQVSQANGSLMRIAPLGIWGHRLPPEELADLAGEDSSLTHPHPVCRESCAVFAVAIADAVGRGGTPIEIFNRTIRWAEANCWDSAVISALANAKDRPPNYQIRSGWVLVALQNAFYQLLHATSLEDGVVSSVMAGGDTDTNAAIAGALLGAVYGRDAVPAQWRSMILSCRPIARLTPTRHPRPRPFWPVDVMELAEMLAALGMEGQ